MLLLTPVPVSSLRRPSATGGLPACRVQVRRCRRLCAPSPGVLFHCLSMIMFDMIWEPDIRWCRWNFKATPSSWNVHRAPVHARRAPGPVAPSHHHGPCPRFREDTRTPRLHAGLVRPGIAHLLQHGVVMPTDMSRAPGPPMPSGRNEVKGLRAARRSVVAPAATSRLKCRAGAATTLHGCCAWGRDTTTERRRPGVLQLVIRRIEGDRRTRH